MWGGGKGGGKEGNDADMKSCKTELLCKTQVTSPDETLHRGVFGFQEFSRGKSGREGGESQRSPKKGMGFGKPKRGFDALKKIKKTNGKQKDIRGH